MCKTSDGKEIRRQAEENCKAKLRRTDQHQPTEVPQPTPQHQSTQDSHPQREALQALPRQNQQPTFHQLHNLQLRRPTGKAFLTIHYWTFHWIVVCMDSLLPFFSFSPFFLPNHFFFLFLFSYLRIMGAVLTLSRDHLSFVDTGHIY